jgi:hypothetical protein
LVIKKKYSYSAPFKRDIWRLVAPSISRRQGRHCEVGSGGSRRQTCDLKDMKPRRGFEAGRVGKEQQSPMRPKAEAVVCPVSHPLLTGESPVLVRVRLPGSRQPMWLGD